jgi:hypothetical protein
LNLPDLSSPFLQNANTPAGSARSSTALSHHLFIHLDRIWASQLLPSCACVCVCTNTKQMAYVYTHSHSLTHFTHSHTHTHTHTQTLVTSASRPFVLRMHLPCECTSAQNQVSNMRTPGFRVESLGFRFEGLGVWGLALNRYNIRTPYHFLMPLVMSGVDFIWSLSNFMIALMHFTRSAACSPHTHSPPHGHTHVAPTSPKCHLLQERRQC